MIKSDRVPGRIRHDLRLPAFTGARSLTVINIQAEEIQRLVYRRHVLFPDYRNIRAEKFQAVLRIMSQKDGVHPPGIVPDVLFDHRIGDILINRTAVPDILSAD